MYKKSQPRLFDVNKIPSQPKRRKKVTLVFDEEKRRAFLGGFHQRKLERKRKAQEQLQQQLKEERKRIKQESREHYKKLVSHRNIPELEELLSRQEYDMKDHTVSILELNIADLKEGGKWIGQNNIKEEKEEEEEQKDNESDSNDNDEIVGMSLQEKQKPSIDQKFKINNQDIKSLKDVRREIKKVALNRIKKSKAFQQKQKIEQQKNKKQSKQKLEKEKQKQKQMHGRKRNKKIKKKSGR